MFHNSLHQFRSPLNSFITMLFSVFEGLESEEMLLLNRASVGFVPVWYIVVDLIFLNFIIGKLLQ